MHLNTTSYDLAICNSSFYAAIENIYSFQPSQGYDFFVNGIKRATMIEVALVIDVATSWSYTQIYYLVSARPDFIVGQFVAGMHFTTQITLPFWQLPPIPV